MTTVVVTDEAVRQMVREALDNKEFAGWSSNEDGPVNVDSNVDPSAAVTDPVNPNFTPQTKTEFGIAVNQLVKNLPDTQMPSIYTTVKHALETDTEEEAEEDVTKKAAQGGTTQTDKKVEEAVRSVVRKILGEAPAQKKFGPVVGDLPPVKKIPAGEHGAEYTRRGEKYRGDLKKLLKKPIEEPVLADDTEEQGEQGEEGDDEEKKRHAYKATAIGGMTDVGGASFDTIAKDLGFSVAGAKQAVDKALEKAKFLGGMDDDDKEILVLSAMNDYIKYLTKSDELTAADVQLMKDHPDIVRELDGFREFLHNAIRRARKTDQKLEDPLGETYSPGEEIKMSSVAPGKKPESDLAPKPASTKAKGLSTGKNLEVDWSGLEEEQELDLESIERFVEGQKR